MRGLSPTRIPNRLGGSLLGHSLEPLADLVRLATEVVEPRQRRQRLEAENTFEQSRRLVADRAGHLRVPAGFRDQAALDQPGDDRVRGNPADPGDVWTRARPEVGPDQAARAIHSCSFPSTPARVTLIGAKLAACSNETSPALRSSSIARNATAASTRDIPTTSDSKSNRRRRRKTARNRSRNCETGGKRKAMCPSESEGGSVASSRSAAPSRSGSCGA